MSDTHTTLTIDQNGVRLDKRLSQQFEYSRSFFEHLFARDAITIRGKPVKKSYKTRPGDKVDIESLDCFVDGGILDEAPVVDLPVYRETEDYLVLYKLKGVLSHPNSIRDVWQPSVVGFLYHHYKDLPSIGTFVRAGLIHRLDRETDGLMLAAKTEEGMAYFKKLFADKSAADTIQEKEQIPLKKYYRALCDITEQGREFLQSLWVAPWQGEGPTKWEGVHIIDADVIPHTPYPVVKRGITKIEKIETQGDGYLVSLEILTGRTHQIRYHLSSVGLPIVGDYLYNDWYQEDDDLGLTAYKLSFTDITGEEIMCEVE